MPILVTLLKIMWVWKWTDSDSVPVKLKLPLQVVSSAWNSWDNSKDRLLQRRTFPLSAVLPHLSSVTHKVGTDRDKWALLL